MGVQKKNKPYLRRIYKSRVVKLWYIQIPGVDYTESFYPVATATTLQTGIATALYFDVEIWICELDDAEAALLEWKPKKKYTSI